MASAQRWQKLGTREFKSWALKDDGGRPVATVVELPGPFVTGFGWDVWCGSERLVSGTEAKAHTAKVAARRAAETQR